MRSFRFPYTVDDRLYNPCSPYPYQRTPVRKPPPQESSAILYCMQHKLARYLREWDGAILTARPLVNVHLARAEDSMPKRQVLMLVDTGADVSTVKRETSDSLGIYRGLLPGENLMPLRSASGGLVAGLRRWMHVWLAGVKRIIPVLVPPNDSELLHLPDGSIASAPTDDILGRAEVLDNFLLCFDNEELDVFARKSRS